MPRSNKRGFKYLNSYRKQYTKGVCLLHCDRNNFATYTYTFMHTHTHNSNNGLG